MEIQIIQNKIYEIRGHRVMLDHDLAELYEVETKVLNQAVKRNIKKFPSDFMFQLTKNEIDNCLKSQFVISNDDDIARLRSQIVTLNNKTDSNLKSQIVTSSWGGIRKLPYAFTEHGVTMLASVLRSDKAIEINIQIVRAFIALRQFILDNNQTKQELEELKKQIRFLEEDVNSLGKDHESYEQHFDDIYIALSQLAAANKERQSKPIPKVGFVK